MLLVQLVVNFSAPWSAPCRSISPELVDKYTSLVFLTFDVGELAEFSNSWEISATPTFIFIKDGRQVDKFVGADQAELKRKIAEVAASKF
ncbi:Thioredoxin H-type [Hibiscus syriacus]|uniref:Thioredoxin H-type n=1 Tax=Hibiscus syriacus TaxID=106335 RepID=A0A6A2WE43_HIBSY|nr:Thioredoxin H-type [Hibiscus syriacus]